MEGEIRNLESEPELLKGYQEWHEHRVAVVREQKSKAQGGPRRPVQGHYIRGEGYLGEKGEGHQKKVFVKNFVEVEPAPQRPTQKQDIPQPDTSEDKPPSWWRSLFR